MAMTKPEAVERFHMALLQVMPQHLPTADYVVKGGANLRLFMESVRRSEGIDLDYVGAKQWALRERMDKVLTSPALESLLAVHRMRIESVNPSKTTDTTGRWKLQLSGPGVHVNSKIEFSTRANRPLFEVSPVSLRLAAAAGMRPALACHYVPLGAAEQKVAALALRSLTQARDIFDLDFLVTRYPTDTKAAQLAEDLILAARRQLFQVSYADYRELVVPFLDPDFVTMFASEADWDRMVLTVDGYLAGLTPSVEP